MRSLALTLHLVFVCWLGSPVLRAEDVSTHLKANDIARMKKIGAAIDAYKKARGDYPPHLGDLVPEFLPDAKAFISPMDARRPDFAPQDGEKFPSSYRYEFSAELAPGQKVTMREVKTVQVEEFGPIVPILRCHHHDPVLNLSAGGEIYDSQQAWESDPHVLRVLKEKGPGPGAKKGKRLMVIARDPQGRPIPNLGLFARSRRFGGMPLPERICRGDEQGRIAIPLGADAKPGVNLVPADADWFDLGRRWNFGDEGTKAGEETGEITITLTPAGRAGGIVRDSQGTPLKEALVMLSYEMTAGDPRSARTHALARTDAGGRWELPGATPRQDPRATILARHGTGKTMLLPLGSLDEKTSGTLFSQKADWRLDPLTPIPGAVTDDERPVKGATVFLKGPHNALQQATSDAEGRFTIGAQEPGDWICIVVARDLAPQRQIVTIPAHGEIKPLRLKLDRGQPRMMRAIHGTRTPAPDLPVLLMSVIGGPGPQNPQPDTLFLPEKPVLGTTDAEGRFVWKNAPNDFVQCALVTPSGELLQFHWDGRKNDEVIVKVPAEKR